VHNTIRLILMIALAACLGQRGASAQDLLKLAIGQRGIWHGATADLGQRAGIFQKHGLKLDILYTSGAGETMQPVISGNIDIGVSAPMPRGRRSASSARSRPARTPIGMCARIRR